MYLAVYDVSDPPLLSCFPGSPVGGAAVMSLPPGDRRPHSDSALVRHIRCPSPGCGVQPNIGTAKSDLG